MQEDAPVNNEQWYDITVKGHQKIQSYVLYQITIVNLVFPSESMLKIRFKQLKTFHEQLVVVTGKLSLPQFPKTNSFAFWNHTNNSLKKIKERQRQIEYYLQKVLNNRQLRQLKVVKNLLNGEKERKKAKSMLKGKILSEQEKLYKSNDMFHNSKKVN